jgi:hypothetical protein
MVGKFGLEFLRGMKGFKGLSIVSIAMGFSPWKKFEFSTSLPEERFFDLRVIWQTDARCERAHPALFGSRLRIPTQSACAGLLLW